MLKDILVELLVVILQVAIIVVGGHIVNFLKAKAGVEEFNRDYSLARTIVMAVEQMFGEGKGADKKQEALQSLKVITNGKLSDEQMGYLIEAIVAEMNLNKKYKQ